MVPVDPPLLLICDLPDSFDLKKFFRDLDTTDRSTAAIVINDAKFANLDFVEVVLDGMTFTISHHDTDETRQRFSVAQNEMIFCHQAISEPSSIGVSLGENIANAKHLSVTNKALLELSCQLGTALSADSVAWRPAGINIGFEFFKESAVQYVSGGPFPALIQVRIDSSAAGQASTVGLSYFADQEVCIKGPQNYPANELTKALVRIVHDVATNGKIDSNIDTNGLNAGETLSFRPSDDLTILNVTLENSATAQLH